MPETHGPLTSNGKFQSTPPVAGRRCVEGAFAERRHVYVSIHAPRCREAMHSELGTVTYGGLFQSTPPVAGRRCALASEFPARGDIRFNPRPPLPGGDAAVSQNVGINIPVSIHAPRCREAMQAAFGGAEQIDQFQSTPPVAGRRCLHRLPQRRRQTSFNPRPPLPGGDARSVSEPTCFTASFNPRPPLPGGDALCAHTYPDVAPVSIHAPRCREAMQRLAQNLPNR